MLEFRDGDLKYKAFLCIWRSDPFKIVYLSGYLFKCLDFLAEHLQGPMLITLSFVQRLDEKIVAKVTQSKVKKVFKTSSVTNRMQRKIRYQ